MVIMIRNGKKKKITKKQFRNYWLNVQAHNTAIKEMQNDKNNEDSKEKG